MFEEVRDTSLLVTAGGNVLVQREGKLTLTCLTSKEILRRRATSRYGGLTQIIMVGGSSSNAEPSAWADETDGWHLVKLNAASRHRIPAIS
jgi:hypothetical protein